MCLLFIAELKSLISGDLVCLGIVRSATSLFEHIFAFSFARRAAKPEAMRTPTYSGINVAFYNIDWSSFCSSSEASKMLKQDLREGFNEHRVDVLLLSGCCGGKDFENFMNDICREQDFADFAVFCQSSYACIVRKSTIKIINAPKLEAASRSSQSPCQGLKVTFNSRRRYQSLNIFNVQFPDSQTRQSMLNWFGECAPSNSLIGGATNSNLFSMSAHFDSAWHWYHEKTHKHGDVMCGKGLTAESIECDVSSAANHKHRMCLVHVTMKLWKEERASLDVASRNAKKSTNSASEDRNLKMKDLRKMPRSKGRCQIRIALANLRTLKLKMKDLRIMARSQKACQVRIVLKNFQTLKHRQCVPNHKTKHLRPVLWTSRDPKVKKGL